MPCSERAFTLAQVLCMPRPTLLQPMGKTLWPHQARESPPRERLTPAHDCRRSDYSIPFQMLRTDDHGSVNMHHPKTIRPQEGTPEPDHHCLQCGRLRGGSSSGCQGDHVVYSITPSLSDILLRAWGYDLRAEYRDVICAASLPAGGPVLELATGSGRMAAVLARCGFRVTSGDREDEKLGEAITRIGSADSQSVQFLRLDMEHLPFPTRSVDTIVCMNTLHELSRPEIALKEIFRVHSGKGPLVVGDFNEAGFEAMQRLHRLVHHKDHPRGTMPMRDAQGIIGQAYSLTTEIATPLNSSLIASGKKFS